VDALLLVVEEASELGPYQDDFLANLQRTQSFVTDGMKDCDAGQAAPARRSLDRVERQMLALRARVRRGRARRTIPRPLATRIADDARAIANDARSLRGVLTCP
jgi:hypothetical protein